MADKAGKRPYIGPKRLIVLKDYNLIVTILCRESDGKFIEQRYFRDHSDYKNMNNE